ncbi:MAG: aspartate dehydrogenase [Candidatus Omnitrophica bacterium]|nr:aspartate dehydrogenase [Candidatus Omnitrophota bacterium]
MKKLKIGLVGCGTIGTQIAKAINTRFKKNAALVAISDTDEGKIAAIKKVLRSKPAALKIDALIKKADLVIEAASAKVSGEVAKKTVQAGKDIMIMSSGGIIKNYTALFNLAKKNGCRVYIPSGAICGLDGVKAALLGNIKTARLTTTKPPAGLKGAPFVEKNKIDLDGINTDTTIFEGSAIEAIGGFPANINVSCALSMAGIGPENTKVMIVASPGSTRNVHEVSVEGEFGKISTRTENIPAPGNPKTSYLAVLSAIAMLEQIMSPIKIGT